MLNSFHGSTLVSTPFDLLKYFPFSFLIGIFTLEVSSYVRGLKKLCKRMDCGVGGALRFIRTPFSLIRETLKIRANI